MIGVFDMTRILRLATGLLVALWLAACTMATVSQSNEPLGDFRLGHNITIADDVQTGPFSRELIESEIETAMQDAIEDRLGRFDGDGLYHVGVFIGAAVLAQPGVPLIYVPSSNMVFEVNVFDNETQARVHEEPHRMVVGEGLENTVPILGSGLTRPREEQIENISRNAARQIEAWLRANEEWFTPKPGQVRIPFGEVEEIPEGAEEAIRPSGA
jgi:hypothetical protein